MRQINDCLRGPLVAGMQNLVEHQCQNDRCGKAEKQIEGADFHRVGNSAPELIIVPKRVKMLQPNPGAFRDTFKDGVVFERDLQPIHRLVKKDEKPNDCRQQHQIDLPIGFQMIDRSYPTITGSFMRTTLA